MESRGKSPRGNEKHSTLRVIGPAVLLAVVSLMGKVGEISANSPETETTRPIPEATRAPVATSKDSLTLTSSVGDSWSPTPRATTFGTFAPTPTAPSETPTSLPKTGDKPEEDNGKLPKGSVVAIVGSLLSVSGFFTILKTKKNNFSS